MKDRFMQQAKREYSPNRRSAALAVEAVVFIGILPLALLLLGGLPDQWLGWPSSPQLAKLLTLCGAML